MTTPPRRLDIVVCPRERGCVLLAVRRGERPRRLDAARIVGELRRLVEQRGLEDVVRVSEACAGGCYGTGPNVSLAVLPPVTPGERPDSIAIGWKTYVGSLATLDCLASIIDQNLGASPAPDARRRRSRDR